MNIYGILYAYFMEGAFFLPLLSKYMNNTTASCKLITVLFTRNGRHLVRPLEIGIVFNS
jgi:hypothetical protein